MFRSDSLPLAPVNVLGIRAQGALDRRHTRSSESEAALQRALMCAQKEEARVCGDEGWCCWWQSEHLTSGVLVMVYLWMNDDTGGRRSSDVLTAALRAEGFWGAGLGRSTPHSALVSERAFYARRLERVPEDL